ncbi:DUF465 domain-containing protein [bacterium]|nr:DUF465 domain-containing protein [bacterium]
MPYKNRILSLKETHRKLDDEIFRLEMLNADSLRIQELKRRKLTFKDEITRLEKLQWEEDTQRTGHVE